MPNKDPNLLPPATLAYIGDAVYELFTRTELVEKGITNVNKLHHKAIRFVSAEAQAKALSFLNGHLSEEEADLVRRGRNAKTRVPKNAELMEYRYSTGFECLVGYLYLSGDFERLKNIMTLVGREFL
ncbi:MAG TPA: ribonuclease III domain-containing protein [Clostridia bacterium]|nr:ribonuclease III domain-containing protein [Clostridia bacterium]